MSGFDFRFSEEQRMFRDSLRDFPGARTGRMPAAPEAADHGRRRYGYLFSQSGLIYVALGRRQRDSAQHHRRVHARNAAVLSAQPS